MTVARIPPSHPRRIQRSPEFDCAPTVQESNVFIPFGLLLSEKQIPRFVGNVSS